MSTNITPTPRGSRAGGGGSKQCPTCTLERQDTRHCREICKVCLAHVWCDYIYRCNLCLNIPTLVFTSFFERIEGKSFQRDFYHGNNIKVQLISSYQVYRKTASGQRRIRVHTGTYPRHTDRLYSHRRCCSWCF